MRSSVAIAVFLAAASACPASAQRNEGCFMGGQRVDDCYCSGTCGGGGGGGSAAMAAAALSPANQMLVNAAGASAFAFGQWLFSGPTPAEQARREQIRQQEIARLRQEKAAAEARKQKFEANKAALLELLVQGSSGPLGLKRLGVASGDGLGFKDLAQDDELARYHRENDRKRETLRRLKGDREETWCKLHVPLRPSASAYDVANRDRAAIESYRRRVREWNERCGGSLDAFDSNFPDPGEDRKAGDGRQPEAAKGGETRSGGGLQIKDLSGGEAAAPAGHKSTLPENASDIRTLTPRDSTEGGSIVVRDDEGAREVGGSGFEDRGAVKKRAEDKYVAPPDASGKPAGAKDSYRGGPTTGDDPASGSPQARLGDVTVGSLQPGETEPRPLTAQQHQALRAWNGDKDPLDDRHWPGPTRDNPMLNPLARQQTDEQLAQIDRYFSEKFEGGHPKWGRERFRESMATMPRPKTAADYLSHDDPPTREDAVYTRWSESLSAAERKAGARFDASFLAAYRDLERRGLLKKGESVWAQEGRDPRLHRELESIRARIAIQWESDMVNAKAIADATADAELRRLSRPAR